MTMVQHEQDLPSHLRHAMRLYGRFASNVERRLPSSEYPPSHRRVLIELFERPGQVDVDVAKSLGMDRTFLSKTVGALIRDGFIATTPGERHRGQRHLLLTDNGRNLARQFLQEHRQAVREEFTATESDNQLQLMAALSFHLPSELVGTWEGHLRILRSKYTDFIWLMSELLPLKNTAIDEALATAALAIGQSLNNHSKVELRLTARRGEKPVGICLSAISANEMDLNLGAIYVAPHERMTGIGGQLLQQTISNATQHTFSKIHASAGDGEVGLIRLLEKTGFVRKRGAQRKMRYGTMQNVSHWVNSLQII